MNQNLGNVKIIKLINGDDIVCELSKDQLPEKGPILRLDRPLQIKYVPQITRGGYKDYIALIKWTGYTNDTIISIPKDKILTITNATERMTKSYIEVRKTYEQINEPKESLNYNTEEFTDEQNDEINDLFNDFKDPKSSIH
jgi:hypothetical protein